MKWRVPVVGAACLAVILLVTGDPVFAADAGVPASSAAVSSTAGDETLSTLTCREHLPEGKARPPMIERFPARGTSGHLAVLHVEIEHGPGERVLPARVQVQAGSDSLKAVEAAGFRFPDVTGPAAPTARHLNKQGRTGTRVRIPVLLLPEKPGRNELVLPSLPIAMARASGEIVTLCTQPHPIQIEDPIANQPAASPRPNPTPKPQQELWEALRTAVYGGIAGLAFALLGALLLRAWLRRPKNLPPPPPPLPPWEVAMQALWDLKREGLIEAGRLGDHFDRVSHVLRRYLGERFGFDGLESTTREIMAALMQRAGTEPVRVYAEEFLAECDLVKFADVTPTEAQCHGLWDRAFEIVTRTTPLPITEQPPPKEET